MKKKILIGIAVIIVLAYTVIGYDFLDKLFDGDDSDKTAINQENSDVSDKSSEDNKDDLSIVDSNSPNEENDNLNQKDDDDETKSDDKEVKEGIPSPLSGIYASEEKVNRRPVAIMFDNHPNARWQAGLRQAEIVYEFRVEYPYTRYMGIFLINDPEQVGPIRSSRPYFVTALLEYDPVYVRVGGSTAAYNYIERLNLADIDGITSGGFWRYYKTGKEIPNNMYSSMEVIRNMQKSRGFRLEGNYEGFKFYEKDTDIDGSKVEEVSINYNKDNSTRYEYDKEKKVYKRYKDGELHIDELDGLPIEAKNIIIQRASTAAIDDVGRLEIDIVGEGKGYYITNGKVIDITWKKDSERSKTRYYNNSGQEIKFNSGQTWIQVTLLNTKISFN
ncbi:DUF3048 domain-containing protein [Sporosalibacterium faouarense]|uniref:DUF3048 domain-containing protein n=1 Tax=Sporosalibacterium faouarense TaxID=516123 RepID=UPI00141C75F8|nr:DUF3048 domain-containing protein [Sporosalibacterium faouarense]MTI49415.1 DUF3048 domain-containing protein [Bacillota bacterium]